MMEDPQEPIRKIVGRYLGDGDQYELIWRFKILCKRWNPILNNEVPGIVMRPTQIRKFWDWCFRKNEKRLKY